MKMIDFATGRDKSVIKRLMFKKPVSVKADEVLVFIDECPDWHLTEQDLKTIKDASEKMKACGVSSEQLADSMKKAFDTFQNMRVEKVSSAEMQLKQAFAKPNIKAEQLQPEYDENYLPVKK